MNHPIGRRSVCEAGPIRSMGRRRRGPYFLKPHAFFRSHTADDRNEPVTSQQLV